MGMEIERKFLVNKEKWDQLNKPEPQFFRQGYFSTNPGKSIRVRIGGLKSYLTIKSETPEISRSEFEYEIPNADAEELLITLCDARLEKNRFIIFYKNKKWEIDVFLKENKGLIVAEIELEIPDENVELPEWIEKEITGNRKYYNAELVKKPFNTW
jgi:CYTH domain-containing protein